MGKNLIISFIMSILLLHCGSIQGMSLDVARNSELFGIDPELVEGSVSAWTQDSNQLLGHAVSSARIGGYRICTELILSQSKDQEIEKLKKEIEELKKKLKKEDQTEFAPELLITPTKTEHDPKKSGFSHTVITKEEIESKQAITLIDAMRGTPGFHFAKTGSGRNNLSSLFTRGSNSNHTLILLDGFKIARDGAQFFEYDIIPTEGIDRIELLRGAGGSLYGSDAVAGVVNVFTRRGFGPPMLSLSMHGGTYSTHREILEIAGGDTKIGYYAAFSRFEQIDGRYDNSDYQDLTFSGRLDYALSDKAAIKLIARVVDGDQGVFTNSGPRFTSTDPDAKREDNMVLVGSEFTWLPLDWWTMKIRLGRYETERLSFDVSDPSDLFGNFQGITNFSRNSFEFRNHFKLGSFNLLSVGGEYDLEETLDSTNSSPAGIKVDKERQTRAFYVQDELQLMDSLFITAGFRIDDNEAYDTETSQRIAAAYFLKSSQTKFRASFGTGITEPSFSQNFGQFGNLDLKPEKSRSFDIGIDQWLYSDSLRLSVTKFWLTLDDMILFKTLTFSPFTGRFVNAGTAKTEGLEVEIAWKMGQLQKQLEPLTLKLGYTNLKTEATDIDEPTSPTLIENEPLIRRPKSSGRLNLDYKIDKQYGINIETAYVGKREDASFVFGRPEREDAKAYTKTDIAVYYQITENLRLKARADNIFGRKYEEVIGYPAPGMYFLGGLEYKLKF